MQPGKFHDPLHMQNSSCKAVCGAVVPYIHWDTSSSLKSMPHPGFLELGSTGNFDRKCLQMTAL